MSAIFFDSTLIREPQNAINLMANVLEASTNYSIIANCRDAAGRLQGVFAAARDITEQAQLQT
ncbi:MAG: hypothetical protein DMG09_07520, partial [Acidobacteria bacterium]